MKRVIKIGSRDSLLAVAQTKLVMERIQRVHPELTLELVTMKTTGDRILDRSLEQIGGKGLFVKELERALLSGKIDLSIHSLKDMPMEQPEELPIVAFFERGDPRDALVLPCLSKEENVLVPKTIGSSSARRRIQLKKLFHTANVANVRGNIVTRLQKLDSGAYDALVLSAAGLQRVGLSQRISRYFTTEEMIPAAGQGILAVQGRLHEDFPFLSAINCPLSTAAALAEREFVRTLNGDCTSPVAAYGQIHGNELRLSGLYYRENKGDFFTSCLTGSVDQARRLGGQLAVTMRKEAELRP